jgi:hypothetical protein
VPPVFEPESPADNLIHPPSFEAPLPTPISIDPPEPTVLLPVPKRRFPDDEVEVASPVLKTMEPEIPLVPASEVWIATEPLLDDVLDPDTILTSPPVATLDIPLLT